MCLLNFILLAKRASSSCRCAASRRLISHNSAVTEVARIFPLKPIPHEDGQHAAVVDVCMGQKHMVDG